jgi:hypothetical protein
MKNNILFLIAAILFYITAVIMFIAMEENKVVFMSAFSTLGIAFTAIYVQNIKKNKK